jgi:hypothetical protein
MLSFRPYQQDAFQKFEQTDFMILFMRMRLGKSIVAIRWMEKKRAHKRPILLLAPTTPQIGWKEELEKEGLVCIDAVDYLKEKEHPKWDTRWICATPQLAVARSTLQRPTDWDGVVCDESTWMKSPKTKQSKLATKVLSRFALRCILTGLPNPQTDLELWPQMAMALGGAWMGASNFWDWRQKHFSKFFYDWLPKCRGHVKQELHKDAFVLSWKDAKVKIEKVYKKLTNEMSNEQREIYNQVLTTWTVPGIETKNALEVTTWLHRIAGGHSPGRTLECWKYEELADLVTTGELAGEPVVVWFAFNRELARMWKLLREREVSATWITGTIDKRERAVRLDRFRKGQRHVILMQMACGKFGSNLSIADTAIYFSGTYSIETREQTEDRIVMPGKTGIQLYIDMLSRDSIDETILEGCKEKRASAKWLLDRIQLQRKQR